MRHRKAGRQLRRTSEQKLALLRNLATSLIENGAIETTEAKAKELRPFVEKLITKARSGTLHDRRHAIRHVHKRETADKLFQELGPKFGVMLKRMSDIYAGYSDKELRTLLDFMHKVRDAGDSSVDELRAGRGT